MAIRRPILVVESGNDALPFSLNALLRREGVEIRAVSSGDEAIHWLRASQEMPEAIFLHAGMAVSQGKALLEQLAEEFPLLFGSLPIIFAGPSPRAQLPGDITPSSKSEERPLG